MPGGKGKIRPEDNPKPFVKGQSGNIHGRPPSLNTLINELYADGKDIKEAIEAGMAKAKKGDITALRELLDRIYGRVKQEVDVNGTIELHFDLDDKEA